MRLSFDHLDRPGNFWGNVDAIWLICTVELTDSERAILRNLVFYRDIGVFWLGHPKGKNFHQPKVSRDERVFGVEVARLDGEKVLSGRPITLLRETPAQIRKAEEEMTAIFSDLKAQIEKAHTEANAPKPTKRTIEL